MNGSVPNLERALQTLRDSGHDVGAAGVKAGALFVTVDGVLRSPEEVLRMAGEGPKPDSPA